ncbi:MAG: hypothetical protein GY850_12860, partial [bacterium]|nr:hypothetical protein [bacterium]
MGLKAIKTIYFALILHMGVLGLPAADAAGTWVNLWEGQTDEYILSSGAGNQCSGDNDFW